MLAHIPGRAGPLGVALAFAALAVVTRPAAPPGSPVRLATQLPAQVVAPPAKVTLYADYASARDGRIDLYVVNRTSQPIQVPTLYGNLFSSLEVDRGSGTWEPVQWYCGVTLSSVSWLTIPPGHFVHGFRDNPASWFSLIGAHALVRYQVANLVSNATAMAAVVLTGGFDPGYLAH
jgi:hypothetical protein